MKRIALFILSVSICTSISLSVCYARILNVPEEYQTIQAGVNAAQDGDTVIAAPGIYREELNIVRRSLVVASWALSTGDNSYVDSTIIDGEGERTTVYIDNCPDTTMTFTGFTVINGNRGGIGIWRSNITLSYLHITSNSEESINDDDGEGIAGGLNCYGVQGGSRTVTLLHSRIDHNRGVIGGFAGPGVGGVMSNSHNLIMRDVEIDHNEGNGCGGAYFAAPSRVDLTDVLVHDNVASFQAGIHVNCGAQVYGERVNVFNNAASNFSGGCSSEGEGCLIFTNSLIHHNSAEREGGGIVAYGNRRQYFTNCLIGYNTAPEAGNVQISSYEGIDFTNSILYGSGQSHILTNNFHTSFNYCLVEFGRDGVVGNNVNWSGCNIDADPLFNDPNNHDFHLSANSPCIDAGDPASDPDPDGSRADLGAFPFIEEASNLYLGGRVVDAENGNPFADVTISGTKNDLRWRTATTDSAGFWGGWIDVHFFGQPQTIQLTVSQKDFLRWNHEITFEAGDSVWIDITLLHSELLASIDSFATDVDSSATATIPISIRNDGNGPLHWSAKGRAKGLPGAEPWTLRQNVNVSQITDDDRILGVVFDGERFYVAGANGTDSSMIYILDREGALVDSFPQPTHTRYGMKDLDWDGELLWGSGDSMVFGMDREGNVVKSWRGYSNPTWSIACDPKEGKIWTSPPDKYIQCYDRNGNNLGVELDAKGLRFYGLAWFPDDPDGYCLYILHCRDQTQSVYKMNVETNDTMKVTELDKSEGSIISNGAYICNNYDNYHGVVFMYIEDIAPGCGGDVLKIMQLQPNNEWLSIDPPAGDVPAGETEEVTLNFRTTDSRSRWSFEVGEEYDGEVVFRHDGTGGETVIPVHMSVSPYNGIDPSSSVSKPPVEFGFTNAYPQPFNSTISLVYQLSDDQFVSLSLTDLMGRDVLTANGSHLQHRQMQSAGEHRVVFDASRLPSGVYLAHLNTEAGTKSIKIVCLK